MFAPVYRNELPHVTEAHRRIALKGWVYSVFSARDLMHGLREEHYGEDKKSLDIEIYDGSEPRLDTLLFDSDNVNRTLAGTRTAHIAIKRIAIGGHVWTVMVYYLPVLEVRQDEQKRMAIAVSGIIISVMLALLLWMLINSRRRVLRLATAMNRDVLERERQLNEAQTVAQIGSWDWHVASTQVVCSKELCRLFGLETTGGSAALETFIELIHPEDRDRVKNAINAALYHKAPYDLEYRIPLPDGRMREVHAQGQVERSVDDEPLRIFGTLMDVTERNRVSREIEASERYQRALLEHLPVAVMVHGADGSMQYCNTLAIQLLGGDRQQLLAQGVDSAYWQFKREDGEDMPVGAYPVNLVLASKAPLHGYVAGIVHPDVKKTSWVLVNGFPYVDEAGQVRQVVVTFVDITALREAEDTLTQAMLELNELYEKSPSGYHSLDSESRIVKINQTELDWLGYHRNELLGKRFAELLSPSSQATFQGNYSQFMQRGYIRDLEYELVCRDGSIKMVLLSATAIYGTDGAFVMSRSTLYDISEIKRLF
jgi:PAS domain S-box-containing protein